MPGMDLGLQNRALLGTLKLWT